MSILMIIFYIYVAVGILFGLVVAHKAFMNPITYRWRGQRVYSQWGRAIAYLAMIVFAVVLWPVIILQNV